VKSAQGQRPLPACPPAKRSQNRSISGSAAVTARPPTADSVSVRVLTDREKEIPDVTRQNSAFGMLAAWQVKAGRRRKCGRTRNANREQADMRCHPANNRETTKPPPVLRRDAQVRLRTRRQAREEGNGGSILRSSARFSFLLPEECSKQQ